METCCGSAEPTEQYNNITVAYGNSGDTITVVGVNISTVVGTDVCSQLSNFVQRLQRFLVACQKFYGQVDACLVSDLKSQLSLA